MEDDTTKGGGGGVTCDWPAGRSSVSMSPGFSVYVSSPTHTTTASAAVTAS